MTFNMTIEREDKEIEVEVECEIIPASKGRRDSCCGVANAGPPLEPDEPMSAEFQSAHVCDDGSEIDLTQDEQERAEEIAREKASDDDYPD